MIGIYANDQTAHYGFPDPHPFHRRRYDAFLSGIKDLGMPDSFVTIPFESATEEEVLRFHSAGYLNYLRECIQTKRASFDYGDTPVYPEAINDSLAVCGAALSAVRDTLAGRVKAGFVPIGGLHHAMRDRASGFCILNDLGVAIEELLSRGLSVAYIDIDAHHGDGVFYGFEDDPRVIVVDSHQRGIFPGTGRAGETGTGPAAGTKLHLELASGTGDPQFRGLWQEVALPFLTAQEFDFILLQCGADSIDGDPITGLSLSAATHGYVTESLCGIANQRNTGIVATGGGGYNSRNIAAGWSQVCLALSRNLNTTS